jgi:hypothetical protein
VTVSDWRLETERLWLRRITLDDADLGSRSTEAVVTHVRNDLGIEKLTAIVSPGNVASIGLIEKLGLSFARMITMPGDDEAVRLYSMAPGRE